METEMIDIERMRDDWRTVAAERKAVGLWSDEDELEAGIMAKAVMDGDDELLMACWAKWLEIEAEKIRREHAMRAQAAAEEPLSPQAWNRRATQAQPKGAG